MAKDQPAYNYINNIAADDLAAVITTGLFY